MGNERSILAHTMSAFDHIVLTAANKAQAAGYLSQLAWRRRDGLFEAHTSLHVVADPHGQRVGSLGATLHALRVLAHQLASRTRGATRLEDLFRGRRTAMIHSGGDSRRLPAYAAQGKIFVPLPALARNGQPAALFDLMLGNLEALPSRDAGEILVCSGDVLLTFDAQAVRFDGPGVAGVAYPASIERGSRHGVYITDADWTGGGCLPVSGFLQKPDEETARRAGAFGAGRRVLVDTGLLSLRPQEAGRLLELAGVRLCRGGVVTGPGLLRDLERGLCPAVDLYEELTFALVPGMTLARYRQLLGHKHGPRYDAGLRALYAALHGTPFDVNVLPHCDFFHIGTSRELLERISMLSPAAARYGFRNQLLCALAEGNRTEGAFVYNTVTTTPAVRARHALIEAVHADRPIDLSGENILVGLPAGARTPVVLCRGLGLVCLPVGRAGWAAVLFGVDDDFKSIRGGGGTFLNAAVEDWLARQRVEPRRVWARGDVQDLWSARLWVAGSLPRVVRMAVAMQGEMPAALRAGWLRASRCSMADLLAKVDHGRLIAHRREIQRLTAIHGLRARLAADEMTPAAELAAHIRNGREAALVFRDIGEALERTPGALRRARLWQTAYRVASAYNPPRGLLVQAGLRGGREALRARALGAVAEAVSRSVHIPERPQAAGILPDQVVWVTTPVRIDLAGGWSDTPPICTERGGTVLNAAITLNGQYPVQVVLKRLADPVIRLSSIDLGMRVSISTTAQLLDHADPRAWWALPKAALVLAGIGPADPKQSLPKWLGVLGGGLELTIFAALPKGSGLGTSSILGAAVLSGLARVHGRTLARESLIGMTSVLEQRMRTGGGWQDQVGGVLPGVKLARTLAGVDQTVSLEWTSLPMDEGSEWRTRLLLYYTGMQRMARGILQNVVGRYLEGDPAMDRIVVRLKESAERMKADLDARDLDAFAVGLETYWALKKEIDPGATNRVIERLLARVDRWTAGRVLPGAGGGGFVLFVAKDATAARRIRATLAAERPNPGARFFDFDIDGQGLRVTTM